MTDQGTRASPLTVLGDALLLLAAMVGLTLSFLSLYGDPAQGRLMVAQTTPLDQCALWTGSFLVLASAFALLALCIWSLPRFREGTAAAVSALLGAAVFFNWDGVFQGAALTVRTVSLLFAQRVSWGLVLQYDPELTLVREGAVTRLFLILALALLALMLGWAVVRARRWWLVVVLTLPPLLPGLLADLYPDWPAFMALAACWCTMLLCDLCRWAAPSGRGKLTLTVLPCVAAALAAITLAFPREGYTRPQWALDMQVELDSVYNRLADFLSRFDGPFGGRVTYVGEAEEADLTQAGPLRYTGRTALQVSTDYDGRIYLRGSSLAVYENGVWTALPEGAYDEYDPPDSVGTLAPFPLYFPALTATGDTTAYTVTVDNVGRVGSCVYAPYHLLVQELEEGGMLPVEDSYLARRSGQWTHTISFAERTPPGQTSSSGGNGEAVVKFTASPFPRTNESYSRYREFVYRHYLGVPEELRPSLERLLLENGVHGPANAGPIDPAGTAREIAALLDRLCEYDTEAPAAPEGTDPVEYFLTQSRKGYCMHYASAAALMLRAMGLPARYVSGFTAECASGQRADVPDRAAHAWVEVWIDNFGWYPAEVTPAAAFEWYEPGPLASFELPSEPIWESEEPEPTPTSFQEPGPEASERPSGGPQDPGGQEPGGGLVLAILTAAAKALAAAAGVFALLWLGQFLPKKYRAGQLNGPDHNRAALTAYGYLLRMRRWGGRMDERAVELAQKARFSQHILTDEELGELRGFVDRERERLCVILDPLPRLAFRYLWGMPKRPKAPENPE